jgi:hypothetical protein
MKRSNVISYAAGLGVAVLLACGGSSSKRDAGSPEGGTDGAGNLEFTVAGCKADTCGAEVKICGWTSSDAKYLGCLSDCENLGKISLRCPAEAAALYACAALGAKVDCTSGKGTGCDAEEQTLGSCLLADAGLSDR